LIVARSSTTWAEATTGKTQRAAGRSSRTREDRDIVVGGILNGGEGNGPQTLHHCQGLARWAGGKRMPSGGRPSTPRPACPILRALASFGKERITDLAAGLGARTGPDETTRNSQPVGDRHLTGLKPSRPTTGDPAVILRLPFGYSSVIPATYDISLARYRRITEGLPKDLARGTVPEQNGKAFSTLPRERTRCAASRPADSEGARQLGSGRSKRAPNASNRARNRG
jgi:hypothetical protein